MKKEKQAINFSVDKELWKSIGVISATDGITKREALEEALKMYCENKRKDGVIK